MIGVHETLKPVLISEYDDEYELLVVEISVAGKEIRLITGVGPHESKTEDLRIPFFTTIEKEVTKAEMDGKSVIIEIDANSKLGPARIPNDNHPMSPNGRLLAAILDRHAMFVVNGSIKCAGTITRKRVTSEAIEESTIDFMIVSDDLTEHIDKMLVDEERKHSLTKIVKNKKKVESDHNPLVTTFNLEWSKRTIKQNTNILNLKNRKGQTKFREETTNNTNLSSVFDDENGDLNVQTNTFLKRLNKTLHSCFKRIRVTEKVDKVTDNLYKSWRKLQAENNHEECKKVEYKLADKIADNVKLIGTETEKINCQEDEFHTRKLWSLKKKLCPQAKEPSRAMVDEAGNIVTSVERLQELSLQKLAVERLRDRDMKEDLHEMRKEKEILCEQNLKKAREKYFAQKSTL